MDDIRPRLRQEYREAKKHADDLLQQLKDLDPAVGGMRWCPEHLMCHFESATYWNMNRGQIGKHCRCDADGKPRNRRKEFIKQMAAEWNEWTPPSKMSTIVSRARNKHLIYYEPAGDQWRLVNQDKETVLVDEENAAKVWFVKTMSRYIIKQKLLRRGNLTDAQIKHSIFDEISRLEMDGRLRLIKDYFGLR